MKITNDYYKKGIDLPWQRVYGFVPEVHVRFNHAPHIRANVDCATCHGPIASQTVAAAERRSHHGLLRGLPQGKEGVERLPDVSLLAARGQRPGARD